MGALEYVGAPSPTNTPVTPTSTRTNTPVTPTSTRTNTPVTPTATKTNTPVAPTATKTNTPVPPTPTNTNMPSTPAGLLAMLPPVLLEPTHGGSVLITRPVFDWEDISGATGYTIQVSTVSNFSSTVVNKSTTSSTYTPSSDLTRSKTLYWRVSAKGSNRSTWSAVFSFTSANPPSVPSLRSPLNNSLLSNYTPLLDWNNPSRTDHYQVQLATSKSFSGSSIVFDKLTTSSNFTPPSPLTPNRTFYWRVRAYDAAGEYSRWSSVRYLHTRLPAPALLSPDNAGITSTLQTFDWGDVNEATGYVIQISTRSSFSTYLVKTSVASSSYSKNLSKGKKYYWRVYAKGTYSSKWSEVRNFITK
ncbi:MAG: hypothetical protein IMZ61_08755 [Planctomycetes bacterium]|nr:hypothetical protein [Planctomycetota bacterium]